MQLAILEMWSLVGVQGSKARGDGKNGALLSHWPSQPLCVHSASGWTMPEHIKALAKHCLPALTFGLLLCTGLHGGACLCVRRWAETCCVTHSLLNKSPLSFLGGSSAARLLGFIVCVKQGMTEVPAPAYTHSSQVFKADHPLFIPL